MLNIAFRTDASKKIGTGHFIRCFSLAQELKKLRLNVTFFCYILPDHFVDLLNQEDIGFVQLFDLNPEPPLNRFENSDWLENSQKRDAQITIQALSGKNWDWIIVDHYALDIEWESMIRKVTKKLLVIDDLANRNHACNLLLDQNYYFDMDKRYKKKVTKDCKLLLGPRYALLRQEFEDVRKKIKFRSGSFKLKRILVFFGGVDSQNYTGLTLKALEELNYSCNVDVIIGSQHPFKDQILNLCLKNHYICHVETNDMANLMAQADISIGAGGTSVWERCCLGLPCITFSIASNQTKLINDAARIGILLAADSINNFSQTIQDHLKVLSKNQSLMKLISNNAMNLVDGKGIHRVVSEMEVNPILIRRATLSDSRNLYIWRNNSTIRANSINSSLISWEQHQKWFNAIIVNKNCDLLIGENDSNFIGVVRFDINKNNANTSIYLVPESKIIVRGRDLLLAAERWLESNRPNINLINATVLGGNEKSKKLFTHLKYSVDTINYKKKLKSKNLGNL